jgi:hypothetical protein
LKGNSKGSDGKGGTDSDEDKGPEEILEISTCIPWRRGLSLLLGFVFR